MANPTSLITREDTSSPVTEAYRTLNTNIKFSNIERPVKTVLVTSSVTGEGKSTTVANLGIVMAQAGNKVLLVDTDLRKPVLHKLFNLNNSTGLTRCLVDTYDVELGEGKLEEYGLKDLFKLIEVQGKTGVLTVNADDDTISVSFDSGRIVNADWGTRPEDKKLGILLIKSGKVTEGQLKEGLLRQKQASQPLGYILLNMGFINIEDLKGLLKLQIDETLRHLLNWKKGQFNFQNRESIEFSNEFRDLSLSDQHLIQEVDETTRNTFIYKQISSFIQETEVENLKVITSGSLPPNPSGLLGSETMQQFLKHLALRFDTIILDSPPVLVVSDASVLASMVDGVILILQSGRLTRELGKRCKEQLEGVKARILGVTINDVNIKKDTYYNYNYYSYYYQKEKGEKSGGN
ncbi:MAG: polysaccharide biosynthesis tyrosine autokinase [Thermodesulfobacteriota bacterium]